MIRERLRAIEWYTTTDNARIIEDVAAEFETASNKFPPFNSAHEGFAVLKEEVDELWEEVRAKQGSRDLSKLRKEAVQVAAMAIRFIHDICDANKAQV